jgi:hypothetical protein
MCYQVKSATKHTRVVGQIHTANQFGIEQMDTKKEDELCVPALKNTETSPVTEDLTTCNPSVSDNWQFVVSAGETVHLKADTVDAPTAADLCFFGTCEGGSTFSADDNSACTFPPPGFSCPDASFVASATGTCSVGVTLCSSSCANPATANYSLLVTRNGIHTELGLIDDDVP